MDKEVGRGKGDSRMETAADWANVLGAEREEAPRTMTWRWVSLRADRSCDGGARASACV